MANGVIRSLSVGEKYERSALQLRISRILPVAQDTRGKMIEWEQAPIVPGGYTWPFDGE